MILRSWADLTEQEQRAVLEKARRRIGQTPIQFVKWHPLAHSLGITKGTSLRRHLDIEWATRERMLAKRRDGHRPAWIDSDRTTATSEDIAARLAEIPPDERSITGRIFGDPLPARSALAQRMARAG